MPRDLNTYREAGYVLEDRAVDAYHSLTGFQPMEATLRAGVVGTYVAGALFAIQMLEEGGFDPETVGDTLRLAALTRGIQFRLDKRPVDKPTHPTPSNDTNTNENRNLLG